MTQLQQYAPPFYNDVAEFDALFDAENALFNQMHADLMSAYGNSFVLTAEESGIAEYERQLRIIANPTTEPLEDRRARIINRLSMRPPLTMQFLRTRLDSIIGKDKYKLSCDYDNYTLILQSSAIDQFWFEEIKVTINSAKPANIIFQNVPFLAETAKVSETISAQPVQYNYRAGTTARTSLATPLGLYGTRITVKGAEQMSIQPILISRIADRISGDIASIVLNDTYTAAITSKIIENGIVRIEYSVPVSSGLGHVTNVKTKNANGDVLSNSSVYYAVSNDMIVKHDFVTKEGV
jgi:hypothetical protein